MPIETRDHETLEAYAFDESHWNRIADSYDGDGQVHYVESFMALLDIREHETVLDIGCGTGLIAERAHAKCSCLIAADYATRMLEIVEEKVSRIESELGIRPAIETKLMAWEDDWDACGLPANSVDVVYASRSVCTDDVTFAIDKMDRTARRACALTSSFHGSHKCTDALMRAAGREFAPNCQKVPEIMNYLFAQGRCPRIEYIFSPSVFPCRRKEMLLAEACGRLGSITVDERKKLSAFVEDNAWQDADGLWRLDVIELNEWAFIYWDVL